MLDVAVPSVRLSRETFKVRVAETCHSAGCLDNSKLLADRHVMFGQKGFLPAHSFSHVLTSLVSAVLTSAFPMPAGPVTPLLPSSPITGTRSNIQENSGIVSSSSSSKIKTPTRPLLAPSTSSLIRSSTHPGNLTLCLPRDYDVIVYRAQGGGSTSEFIQVN